MHTSLPATTESRLAPRLLVSFIAALSLLLGPLAFSPAHAATVSVSGVIEVLEGESALKASVWIEQWVADGQNGGRWEDRGTSTADENGAYRFENVQSGKDYRVVSDGPANETDGFGRKYGTAETANFEVTDVPVTVPTLKLRVGGTISGVTTADGDTTGFENVRVVAARFLDGRYQYEREVESGEGGTYSVIGLRDGVYQLRFDAKGYLSEYFDNVMVDDDATGFQTVTIKDGNVVVGKDASLTEAAVVSGQVSGPDGALSGIIVSAYRKVVDEDGPRWESFQRYASTDDEGMFAIDDLPAGTYRIGFVDYEGEFVEEFYNDKAAVDAAGVVEFTLAAGDTQADINAVLAPAGAISGTLTGPTGDALDYGCAYALGTVDGQYRELGIPGFSEGSDEYIIRGLAAGTYKVRFADCSGSGTLAPEYFDNQATLAAAREITVVARETVRDINGSLAPMPVVAPPVVAPPAPYSPPAAPKPVAKKSATVKVDAKGAKKKATLTITVKASGVTPSGKVTIKLGGKTLKTLTLKGGKAKVTLTKQKKGSRTYKIAYSGDSKVRAKSTTSVVKIK
jgi:hypothetical protein